MGNKTIDKQVHVEDFFYKLTKTNYCEWSFSEIKSLMNEISKSSLIRKLNKYTELGYMQKIPYWVDGKKSFKYKFTGKFPSHLQFLEMEYRVWIHHYNKKLIKKVQEEFGISESYFNWTTLFLEREI